MIWSCTSLIEWSLQQKNEKLSMLVIRGCSSAVISPDCGRTSKHTSRPGIADFPELYTYFPNFIFSRLELLCLKQLRSAEIRSEAGETRQLPPELKKNCFVVRYNIKSQPFSHPEYISRLRPSCDVKKRTLLPQVSFYSSWAIDWSNLAWIANIYQ